MYSRMAVAMAVDLGKLCLADQLRYDGVLKGSPKGLHVEATVQLAATQSQRDKVRATWWSVVMIDRINSWGELS